MALFKFNVYSLYVVQAFFLKLLQKKVTRVLKVLVANIDFLSMTHCVMLHEEQTIDIAAAWLVTLLLPKAYPGFCSMELLGVQLYCYSVLMAY